MTRRIVLMCIMISSMFIGPSVPVSARGTVESNDTIKTMIYIGSHIDQYSLKTNELQRIISTSTIEQAYRLTKRQNISTIYIDHALIQEEYADYYHYWYDQQIMVVGLDTSMATLTKFLNIDLEVDAQDPRKDELLASMIWYQHDFDHTSRIQTSTYFTDLSSVIAVVDMYFDLSTQSETPRSIDAASVSVADGYGGYAGGTSWVSGDGNPFLYANGFTYRNPSSAYYNFVHVTGSTNCGGWHTISSASTTTYWGNAQRSGVLAGSTQCPDPQGGVLKVQSSSSHTIQTYPGSNFTSFTTSMIR